MAAFACSKSEYHNSIQIYFVAQAKGEKMTQEIYIIGFPRIGERRELKKALERFWAGKIPAKQLHEIASEQRKKHWLIQKEKGVGYISSNDFSYYDNMLDTAVMLNAIPARFVKIEDHLDRYFAMARGTQRIPAMEMTKWFNTNYHYIVPELSDEIEFKLNPGKIISEYREAKRLGIKTKINIIGPVTFCALSKTVGNEDDVFNYFSPILSVYKELFEEIAKLDDRVMVHLDEPLFVKNPSGESLNLLQKSMSELCGVSKNIDIVVATYFEQATELVNALANIPIWGIALDFVCGPKNIDALGMLNGKKLIAGVVDGRNIWKSDVGSTVELLASIADKAGMENVIVSSSCSLLHLPYSVQNEPDSDVKKLMAFACEKIDELMILSKLFRSEELGQKEKDHLETVRQIFQNADATRSAIEIVPTVRQQVFEERKRLQKEKLNLPELPTTTIGSFPQTHELRKLRRDFRKGGISDVEYEKKIKKYIHGCVFNQEKIGLDVFVHGEPERTDMVEYFGELLDGFHFTSNGWVQSYGSRCVKPPVIYGDVSRPQQMTVKWITYAQSLTDKPVKGMLTGPVTILNWSFVRTDIPRSKVAMQIADSLKREIDELQQAGIRMVQVDEAAFKEGYPLRTENIGAYEEWAVTSFKHTVSSAKPETQIHTHMCYSQFNDMMDTIKAMDADVLTIETARSGNKLLKVFQSTGDKNALGPGVYDIHSTRVPSSDEFVSQIDLRLQVIDRNRMWVNPDCGLKTRCWEEVIPALSNMVAATKAIRNQ
jgi:5-methyltetrahydropteroyltriglutamate--homocysteine methyltransferase